MSQDSKQGNAQPSITCSVCSMTSYNPNDIREGYCGNCHAYTTPVAMAAAHVRDAQDPVRQAALIQQDREAAEFVRGQLQSED